VTAPAIKQASARVALISRRPSPYPPPPASRAFPLYIRSLFKRNISLQRSYPDARIVAPESSAGEPSMHVASNPSGDHANVPAR